MKVLTEQNIRCKYNGHHHEDCDADCHSVGCIELREILQEIMKEMYESDINYYSDKDQITACILILEKAFAVLFENEKVKK